MKREILEGFAAAGLTIEEDQARRLASYGLLLREWNEIINLTAIIEPEAMVAKHFVDCAHLAHHLPRHSRGIDIGSGAGFPGIVVAVLRPDLEIELLDGLEKRTRFQEMMIDHLGLENVRACHHARAEVLAHEAGFREGYDWVTSRAVASLPLLLELSCGFLRIGGRLFAMKGPGVESELRLTGDGFATVGMNAPIVLRYMLPSGDERSIVLSEKLAPTPDKYPRRPKAMERKPLGS